VREIQEAALAARVPSVVFGGVYPTTVELPSVDLDQADLGYQLARHLLSRGRQRIAFITRETWLPGDNQYHDGIRRALAESHLGNEGVMIRSISPDVPELVRAAITELLRQKDRPTGLVCRGPVFADAALEAAGDAGLDVPHDLDIVFDHWARCSEVELPHTYPVLSYKAQAQEVGKKLAEVIAGRQPEPLHTVLPVRGPVEEEA
jgi:DNA-binding LacI/PurR family transcriptional regulator